MSWLSALIALFKAWLGFKADQAEKAGEVKQSNAVLTTNATLEAELRTAVVDAGETRDQKLEALKEGGE